MRAIDLIVWPTVVSLILIFGYESKHFCDRFKVNNNRISYVFRRLFSPPTDSYTKHNIIIDGNYWTIVFTDSNDKKTLSFEDEEQKTRSAPFFAANYSGAACIWFGNEDSGQCRTALFHKNETHRVVLGEIPGDDFKSERDLSDYRYAKTVTVKELSSLNPAFILTSVYEWFNAKVLFIERTAANSFVAKRYSFYESSGGLTATFDKTLNDAIKKYSGPHLIFGISPQRSFSNNVDGLLVLMKDHSNHHRLVWCWVPFNSADCSVEELVDCSHHQSDYLSSQTRTSIMIGVIVVFVGLVFILSAALVMCVLGKADKVDAPNAKSDPNRGLRDSGRQ